MAPVDENTDNQSCTEVILSDGRIASIKKGRGEDVLAAGELSPDRKYFIPTLVSLLTTIDGKQIQMEDITNLYIDDYMTVMDAFGKLNPLLPQQK